MFVLVFLGNGIEFFPEPHGDRDGWQRAKKEQQSFGHTPAQGPLFRVPSVFIPGFVSHHDTYFSFKQNRLFVTIVSPLLSFTAKHNRFKEEGKGGIKASFWIGKKKIK